VIRRLVLDIPTVPGSVFQWQTDYRTMEYVITRNGRPVMACTTAEERDGELADLQREVKTHTPKTTVPPPVFLTGEALRRKAEQDASDLFGFD
jgi:hypothetical protein